MSTENLDQPCPARTLVLCFDGTGNLFDDTNTNVVKLFSLLKRDNQEEQAGIGTYSAPGIMGGFQLWAAKELDQAVAWYLDAHVKQGYQFLMQNYREGDHICLFGFSRGAYTARALAGMLYKVGLLPKDNSQQINFAYKMYKSTGKKNRKLAFEFKRTFSRTVQIEFMGCWDTVSSVGILWSHHLPFTSSNTIIKRFRHALSLDERRAKFQPNLWHRDAPDHSAARKDPEHGSFIPRHGKSNGKTDEGEIPFEQPGPKTDVLEVWFAGGHSDIGGGDTPSDRQRSLCNISLRWMVREIVASQCGILFDADALARSNINLDSPSVESSLVAKMAQAASKHDANGDSSVHATKSSVDADTKPELSPVQGDNDSVDALEQLHDELKLTPIWWALEIIPLFVSWQDEKGTWHRAFRWNLGRGRTIPTANPNVHTTVQQRMADKTLGYIPKAAWSDKPNANWMT